MDDVNFKFYPKQYMAFTGMVPGSDEQANEVFYGGAVAGGKSLHIATSIKTPNGWTTMGDIQVGEKVFTPKGQITPVVAKSNIINQDTYEVTFDNHEVITACKDHSWKVKINHNETKIMKTEDLFKLLDDSTVNISVDVTQPLYFPEIDLPIPPRLLGIWLGEGKFGNYIRAKEYETVDYLNSLGATLDDNGYAVPNMYTELDKLNLIGNPHIPIIYLHSSIEQRTELLKGFIDTKANLSYPAATFEINLAKEQLAFDVQELLIGLSIKVNLKQRKDKSWRMKFSTDKVITNLSRFLERWGNKAHKLKLLRYWRITEIVKIPDAPTQCIQVEDDEHLFLAGRCMIPTHNSFLMRQALLLWCLFIPGITCVILRRKYSEVISNHLTSAEGYLNILDPFVKAGKCTINLADKSIKFIHEGGKNSYILLRAIQHEKDMYSHSGAEYSVLCFDEATQFTKPMYEFLRTRNRIGGLEIDYDKLPPALSFIKPGFFPRILSASNPGGISGAFFKKSFIDPHPPLTIWDAAAKDGGMKRLFVPAFLHDNTIMMEQDPNYRDKIIGAGGNLAKKLLEGRWDVFDDSALGDIWDSDVHVIAPFNIPDNADIVRVMDWGTFHPSVILYVLIAKGEIFEYRDGSTFLPYAGSQIVIAEIYNCTDDEVNEGNRKSAFDVGKQMAAFEASVSWGNRVRPSAADNQIFQRRGGIKETMNDLIMLGYNTQVENMPSCQLSHKGSLFTRADQSTGSRVSGLNLVRAFLENAVHGEERGLYFFNVCRRCIETIPGLPRSDLNPEDVDASNSVPDHAFDCVKYSLLAKRFEYKSLSVIGM